MIIELIIQHTFEWKTTNDQERIDVYMKMQYRVFLFPFYYLLPITCFQVVISFSGIYCCQFYPLQICSKSLILRGTLNVQIDAPFLNAIGLLPAPSNIHMVFIFFPERLKKHLKSKFSEFWPLVDLIFNFEICNL